MVYRTSSSTPISQDPGSTERVPIVPRRSPLDMTRVGSIASEYALWYREYTLRTLRSEEGSLQRTDSSEPIRSNVGTEPTSVIPPKNDRKRAASRDISEAAPPTKTMRTMSTSNEMHAQVSSPSKSSERHLGIENIKQNLVMAYMGRLSTGGRQQDESLFPSAASQFQPESCSGMPAESLCTAPTYSYSAVNCQDIPQYKTIGCTRTWTSLDRGIVGAAPADYRWIDMQNTNSLSLFAFCVGAWLDQERSGTGTVRLQRRREVETIRKVSLTLTSTATSLPDFFADRRWT